MEPFFHLALLGVDPGARRYGVGKALLDHLIATADESRATMSLNCEANGLVSHPIAGKSTAIDALTADRLLPQIWLRHVTTRRCAHFAGWQDDSGVLHDPKIRVAACMGGMMSNNDAMSVDGCVPLVVEVRPLAPHCLL